MRLYRILLASGYLSIFLMALLVAYTCHNEQRTLKLQEEGNQRINELRQDINRLNMQIAGLSFQGETVAEWDEDDMAQYHMQRLVIDSTLYAFSDIFQSKRTEIDTLRMMLADKEARLNELAGIHLRQRTLNRRIADIVPVIARQSSEEKPSKPKRKGFLGIFGKKEEAKPTVTTTMLHSLNSNVIREQKAQSRRLSEQADSLAARNAELNMQLQTLINRIDRDVQRGLQTQEAQTASMRRRSFMQIGSLTGCAIILLLCLFIIIHRDTNHIRRYRRKTGELIGQLKKSVQQNEALIASRKKAVHTITHELRTPLTAITGYTKLLQKECSKGNNVHFLQSIQQSSDRMRDMLNALLDFFRLDNGKEQPRLSPCRISTIVHTLETEFMPIAMNKGLSLTVKDVSDAVVLTDKERIIQIGNNLLSNAIKFTEEGGVSLTTGYTDGVLIITVEDTGTGMTEEEQRRVFGAFERLSNAAAKDGFGLGLAIVHNIVTMLHGTIQLDSEKGKGSRFTVEIPMSKAEEVPEKEIQTYIHRQDRNLNVVAIDNDEVLLLMLKEMYAQEGIHCDTCTDAAELMEMLRRKEYNLLLTDLNMPGMNGFELLELLHSSNVGNSQTIPVVVATASGSCDAEELLAKGFAGCLFKPFSISELMEVSDKCAIKGTLDGKLDFSALLSYGNEVVMLEKLITETEKEMKAVRDAATEKDLQKLDALTHHLRSSWEILRADQPKGAGSREGEVVFLLDGKDYRTRTKVEQYDYEYGDGEVLTVQTATKGAGVDLVFMGDCFDAKDIAEGKYLDAVNEAIGYFFAVEPYKTYRDYFNVYTVFGLSPDSGVGDVNTIRESKFGSAYALGGITPDEQICFEYACKAPTVTEDRINRTLITLIENTADYGGITYMWGDGSVIACCPMSEDVYPYDFRGLVQHEAGGHGFGKLGDEYIYHNDFIQTCPCLCCPHVDEFNANKSRGWYENLSLTGNMYDVPWSHLIFDPQYSNLVDVYEGGYMYMRGVFRSEPNSCMNNNIPYFSAISREAIVKRIKEYAGESYSFEEFKTLDVLDASTAGDGTRSISSALEFAASNKQQHPVYMGDKPKFN